MKSQAWTVLAAVILIGFLAGCGQLGGKDPIIGKWQDDDGLFAEYFPDGTYVFESVTGGTIKGTWKNNRDGYYEFTYKTPLMGTITERSRVEFKDRNNTIIASNDQLGVIISVTFRRIVDEKPSSAVEGKSEKRSSLFDVFKKEADPLVGRWEPLNKNFDTIEFLPDGTSITQIREGIFDKGKWKRTRDGYYNFTYTSGGKSVVDHVRVEFRDGDVVVITEDKKGMSVQLRRIANTQSLEQVAQVAVAKAPAKEDTPLGRQERTMADLEIAATAIESYAVDNNFYPCPVVGDQYLETIQHYLAPTYIRQVPTKDAWGNKIWYFCEEMSRDYPWGRGALNYMIYSLGSDGRPGPVNCDGAPAATKNLRDDICFKMGEFVVWPEEVSR